MDKGVRGPENWAIFMDVICVSSLIILFLNEYNHNENSFVSGL